MAVVRAQGFANATDFFGGDCKVTTRVGGRVDAKRDIEGITVIGSLTDASLQTYENAPWVRDAIITGEANTSGTTKLLLGFDAGARSVFTKGTVSSNIGSRPATASATWFQAGNHVRLEGSAKLQHNLSLWGAHTLNDYSHLANSTQVNLREREGFVIAPFTVPIANSAAALTYVRAGEFDVEPSFDFNRRAAYLSVGKIIRGNKFRASYSFKDEEALFEVGLTHKNWVHASTWDRPLARVYLKTPFGRHRGFIPSFGVILDKTIEL